MPSPEKRIKKAIRESDGFWTERRTGPLGPGEDEFFLEPAREKFPLLEDELFTRYGLKIPENWQLQDALAVLVTGEAFLLNEMLPRENQADFSKNTAFVSLIVDDYHLRGSLLTMVGFEVRIGKLLFYGTVFSPCEYWCDDCLYGLPNYIVARKTGETRCIADKARWPLQLTADQIIEEEKFTKLIDFVVSQIATT